MTVAPAVAPPPVESGSRGKNAWIKWVALGCGGLLVVVAVFVLLMITVVRKATAGPEAAVQSFLAAAGSGHYAAAYDFFSAPLREAQSLEAFESAAKKQASLFKVRDTTFSSRSVDNAVARLSGTLTLESGTKVPASFQLVEEKGRWKLIAYNIASGED